MIELGASRAFVLCTPREVRISEADNPINGGMFQMELVAVWVIHTGLRVIPRFTISLYIKYRNAR